MTPLRMAYAEALAADAAWSVELKACFGIRAGDVRYTRLSEGAAGTTLRRTYDNFRRTNASWHRLLAQHYAENA